MKVISYSYSVPQGRYSFSYSVYFLPTPNGHHWIGDTGVGFGFLLGDSVENLNTAFRAMPRKPEIQ